MSRSCYSDDLDSAALAMWRGRVMSAIRGRRGQRLLRDLLSALEAMPDRELIRGDLVVDGACCALGAVALHRGLRAQVDEIQRELPRDEWDDHDDGERNEMIAAALDVATCMVQEIADVNDDWGPHDQTPAQRHARMLAWVRGHLAQGKEER
ncbi:MAG TPA: hypothetical protein PKC43_06140 [Phycisphaerales bacterium]|nr:hypothetical protein [Phycisphaerales bacterium]HMP37012.1 hypothetical protein [Phycisphaerales bacterium]